MPTKKKNPNISRIQAREIEKKFTPALKVLSSHMHNTGPVTNDFIGYKVPAGTFTDRSGREWQVQAHAVCSKAHKIKKDEIIPIIRKWAIGLKVRTYLKYFIDKLYE